ncbi:hypothetical protein EW026_g4382 [Hermanssonia centrifuga]|uniref:F-box domain-containing protein n=1 Tax=Hermanssonia centrifuga TaxID=98765 RepID=A0A4S4KI49_9APHY|nr:hypothetical protein EW026_g4382 [Hermanssonia centrifuga]
MSLAALPVELLEAIFEPLPPATLVALACTSADLYLTASRFLYRDLSISSYARNLTAVATLASQSHLALLVRSFTITIDDGEEHADDEYYSLLHQAVARMQELTSLEMHIDANSSWVLDALPLQTKPYSRLQHFASSFPLDTHTASFFLRTPSLQSLQLAPSSDYVTLASSAIPLLTTYTGPPSLLTQLLPSRPVSSLHLSGDLSLDDIEHLAVASGAPIPALSGAGPEYGQTANGDTGVIAKIETLSTITSASPVAVIEALAKACPGLVCLRVITTCAFWETPDVAFYTQVASILSSLPSLSAFELSGMHWEFRPKSSPAADKTCTEKEWVSPPVTPRPIDVDLLEAQDRDFDFDEAFMEWAY